MMNWLIIIACLIVAWLQFMEALQQPHDLPGVRTVPQTPADPNVSGTPSRPGITETYMLKGWGLKGLFGHMWLHGGLLHLLGNMWFLWIFGNAVCAKVGNIRYLLLYVLFGVAAAVAQLLISPGRAVGASGAIFGVIGMFLVLFFENRITCYFFFWFIFIRPIIHSFTVSSMWMILFWVASNIFWAIRSAEGSRVAYFAHLGGFATGFAVAWLMCYKGWLTMERYEKSLLQMWQERRDRRITRPFDPEYARLGAEAAAADPIQAVAAAPARPLPCLDLESGSVVPANDGFLHATCSCGQVVKASRQYGGQTVCCPACKGEVMMPEALPAERPSTGLSGAVGHDGYIRFACSCGKRIKVSVRQAGRRGRCPRCDARIRVPRAPEHGHGGAG